MEVSYGMSSLVLTMFDDIVEMLLLKKAAKLMEELGHDAAAAGVSPKEILLLIWTQHVFEIKSNTYYNHGMYESFTLNGVSVVAPKTVEGSKNMGDFLKEGCLTASQNVKERVEEGRDPVATVVVSEQLNTFIEATNVTEAKPSANFLYG